MDGLLLSAGIKQPPDGPIGPYENYVELGRKVS